MHGIDVPRSLESVEPFEDYLLGGGETRTTLSPRTIIVPSFFVASVFVTSSASSSTRFMCWSKLYNLPLTLRPPFSWTRTTLFRLSSKILAATSDIQSSTGEVGVRALVHF